MCFSKNPSPSPFFHHQMGRFGVFVDRMGFFRVFDFQAHVVIWGFRESVKLFPGACCDLVCVFLRIVCAFWCRISISRRMLCFGVFVDRWSDFQAHVVIWFAFFCGLSARFGVWFWFSWGFSCAMCDVRCAMWFPGIRDSYKCLCIIIFLLVVI